MLMNRTRKTTASLGILLAALLAGPAAFAQTTVYWGNPALVTPTVASTSGSANLTVSGGTWAVGDIIRFTGTTAALNPFNTTATHYYVVSVSGSTLQVSASPGGTALNAVNTTSASTTSQAQDWFTANNWAGGVVPNSSTTIAAVSNAQANAGTVINGNATVYGVDDINSSAGTDVTLISGGNGTSRYPLTFATTDSTVPKLKLENTGNFLVFLGTSSPDNMPLKIAGTQGLDLVSMPGGAITNGSGVTATCPYPNKQMRFNQVDWTSLSGGLQIERGYVQPANANQFPSPAQSMTVGNAQTIANNLLAGLNLNGQSTSVDALNGNVLGRIWGNATLTVGAANGSGTYAGVIGQDFAAVPSPTSVTKSGTGTETISGPIVGTGALTVSGGTLILSSANTYSGTTTVSAGTLQVTSAQLTTNTITVANGAVLTVTASGSSQLQPKTLTFGSTSATTLNLNNLASTTAAPIAPGTVTLNGTVTVNITSGTFVSGNSYPLMTWTTKSGSGSFTLGTTPLTANLSISSSTLYLNVTAVTDTWTGTNNANWDITTTNWSVGGSPGAFSNGSTALFDDTAAGTTNVTVAQLVQPGSVVFNNSNLTYSVTATSGNYIGGSGSLTVGGGGKVTLAGPNTYSGGTILSAGQLNLNYGGSNSTNSAIGTGSLTVSGGQIDNTSGGNVTLLPAIAQNWNGSFAYVGSAQNLNLGTGAVTLNTNCQVAVSNNTLTVGGVIGGAYALTNAGPGTLALTGANSFSGGLYLTTGTVQAGNASALGTGASQLGAGVLDLNGSSLANSNNINSGAFVLTNSSSSAGAWVANSHVNTSFTIGAGAGSITVARLIDTGSPLTVTKVGAGTLTFNGAGYNNLMAITVNAGTTVLANTGGSASDRGVTLNGGILKLGATGYNSTAPNANEIGDNQPFTINGGTFDVNGWNETVATINGTNGVILNNATGTNSTLTIGGDNGTHTFSGTIQNGAGTLGLTMIGSGVQTLSGLNTYTGGTTITNSATLQAGTNNAFPAGGDMNVVSGTLDLNTFTNTIGGLNGAGTVDTVAGGTPTLTVGSNGDGGNFSGSLQNSSGTLSLTKVGAGMQGLTGNNSYSGSTTVSNGTLVVGSSLSGAGAVTVYGSAVLNVTNTSPSIAGAVTLASSGATLSLLDNNIGTLSLNNGLTLSAGNVLKFDINSAGADSITVSGGFTQSGTTTVYLNQINAPSAGTYTLISGASGINASHFTLGNTLSGYTLTLTSDSSDLYLNVALTAPASAYWDDHVSTAWNGHSGSTYNWDTDQSSGNSVTTLPGAPSAINFAANGANNFNTTLGANFTIASLNFNVGNNVTIGGANTLTLDGPITVNSGAGANSTISAGSVVLGADQNITVADSTTTLYISSPISGPHALNVNPSSGSGTVALSGASSYTGGTTIAAGTLALTGPNALPTNGTVNINGGTLGIGSSTGTVAAVTLVNGNITGSSGVLRGSSYNVQNGTVAANLGGTAALTMTGSSVLLASNSTYSGGTIISSGILQLGASNALGSGSVSITASTELDLNGQSITNLINYNGNGTLYNTGPAAAAVTTDATVNSPFTIDTTGGNITVARLISGAVRTLTAQGGNTLTFNGAGHNNLIELVVTGPTVVCANNGGYSVDRGLTLNSGTIQLAGPGNGGAAPNANLINPGTQFEILGGIFDLNGWNETVATVIGSAGVIENNAAGTNSTLSIGGDNGTNTYSGAMQDGNGVLSITKVGTGIQTLSGTCTYSGNTTIANGQLVISASAASPNSTYVVNTNGGLQFYNDTAYLLGGLSGSGNVTLLNAGSSAIALAVGSNNLATTYSGILSDGGNGSTLTKVGAGTLTLSGANTYTGLTTVSNGVLVISSNYVAGGNVTVNEGAAFGVTGNTPTTSAQVGTLTLGISGSGSSALLFASLPYPAAAPLTVSSLSPIGGSGSVIISNTAALQVGTYNLVNYTNLTGVGFNAFALGSLPPGTVAHLANNTAATPKVIQLVVTAVAPQTWSGAVNTNWDIAATANWKLNGVSTNYHDLSPVQFDDTVGSGYTTVSLVTNVQPSIVTVSNNTKSYTFTTGSGSGIYGATGLTKNGTGTLTLVNLTNSFSGVATINAGKVVLSSSTLGGSAITDNGSLVFSNGSQTISTIISGAGSLVQNGGGFLDLFGANAYGGGTTIANGTIQTDNTNALGYGTVTLGDGVSGNNATLQASPAASFANTNPIVVAAGGTGIYAIQAINTWDYHVGGNVALNNALTLRTTANGALWVDGTVTSGGANPTVTVDGGGATTKFVSFTANNAATFTGNIIITNQGDFKAGNTNALSAANTVALDSTSTFDNGSRNLTIAGLNNYGAGGGTVADAGNGDFLTLGGSGAYSFSGVINNAGGIVMNGSGQQTLSGANVYTGPTLVSNGTLVVSGSLASSVTVAGGTLSPGLSGSTNTMTASSTLTVQASGTLALNINKTAATQDQIVGLTTITYGGTLAVTNLAGTLTTSDSFKLFSAGTYAGAFAAISPAIPAAGLVWNTNTLTTDGTLRVASASAPLSGLRFTAAPVISGTTLTISATNAGAGTVYLLTTTNLAVPVSSWTPIWTNVLAGSGSFTTNLLNAVNPGQSQQFYLLSNTNN